MQETENISSDKTNPKFKLMIHKVPELSVAQWKRLALNMKTLSKIQVEAEHISLSALFCYGNQLHICLAVCLYALWKYFQLTGILHFDHKICSGSDFPEDQEK